MSQIPKTSQDNSIYHTAKDQNAPKTDVTLGLKFVLGVFWFIFVFRQHKSGQLGVQVKSFNNDLDSFWKKLTIHNL